MNKWAQINSLINTMKTNFSDEEEDILFYLKDWKRLKKLELRGKLNGN